MSDLWLPGVHAPQDELVARIHRQIERFASTAGVERAFVQVELADGARFALDALTAEPGYGFVTLRPQRGAADDDEPPEELIVPVGMIRRIELDRAEDVPGRVGFSPPA
jgi:hypothetical protein